MYHQVSTDRYQCLGASQLVVGLLFSAAVCAQPTDAVRLSTSEINQAFADVCDYADVQDSAGTTAVNQWHSNGVLINVWSNGNRSGTVTGSWHADNDLRCVTIVSGIPELENTTRCGPVYRRGDDYFSINADGSVHGVHRLSSMNVGVEPVCAR